MTRGAHKEIVQKNADLGEIKVRKRKRVKMGLLGVSLAVVSAFSGSGVLGAHPGENGEGQKLTLSDKSAIVKNIDKVPKHDKTLLAYAGDEKNLAKNDATTAKIANPIPTFGLKQIKIIPNSTKVDLVFTAPHIKGKPEDLSGVLKTGGMSTIPDNTKIVEGKDENGFLRAYVIIPGTKQIARISMAFDEGLVDFVSTTAKIDFGAKIEEPIINTTYPLGEQTFFAMVSNKRLFFDTPKGAFNKDISKYFTEEEFKSLQISWSDKDSVLWIYKGDKAIAINPSTLELYANN